jgi:transposase-like protein
MVKNGNKRRVYMREFKAEAAAPAEKREKPISRIAGDLGGNESVPRPECGSSGRRLRADCPRSPDTDISGTGNWPDCGRRTKPSGRTIKS